MSEDYVSYDLAGKLKSAGFNELTNSFYDEASVQQGEFEIVPTYAKFNEACKTPGCECVAAPTLAHAQKWLREIRHIDINIDLDDETNEPYTAEIYKDKKCVVGHWELGFFATYEQALSASIAKALELINNKL